MKKYLAIARSINGQENYLRLDGKEKMHTQTISEMHCSLPL